MPEEPSRTNASTGPDLEKFAARLRCRECAKEGASFRLRREGKADPFGVAADATQGSRDLRDSVIVHRNDLYAVTAYRFTVS